MFGRHKKQAAVFDKSGKVPVLRTSICTGERVAGFRDAHTGSFCETVLIRTDADLRDFLKKYGVSEKELRREW